MQELTAGAKLRQDIQSELDENDVVLDSKEAALFEQAVQTAELLEALERSIQESGPTVPDPKTGAPTIAPAVVEARLQRQVLQRLLGGLDLEGRGSSGSPASQHGRMAANKRWQGHNANRGR